MRTFEAVWDLRPHLLRDGITARAVHGERMTMAVVDLDPNAHLPEHHHENEQMDS
jgi:quercetin dioxygenase-like cupin family protein